MKSLTISIRSMHHCTQRVMLALAMVLLLSFFYVAHSHAATFTNGDMNNDGKVTAIDLSMFLFGFTPNQQSNLNTLVSNYGKTVGTTPPPTGSWWKPTASAPISWNWVIGKVPTAPFKAVNVYDIDGFDSSAATVSALHAQGSKVICYIDVGTYEPGRSDTSMIPAVDIGSAVEGWPGEKWLNIADVSGLTPLINSRMQLCANKGFDAIEPDNIDGYTNNTGFPLTAAQQITFNKFLATTAHNLGLSIGLKNDVDQASQLASSFDWALNEECNKYTECDTMTPFTAVNKAVFNAEYKEDGETTAKFCAADAAAHINGVLFSLDLNDSTYQPCTNSW